MTLTLGIDPGLAPTGWGLIERKGSVSRHVAHGVLKSDATLDEPARVAELARGFTELLALHRPDLVAIERWVHFNQGDSTQAHALGLVIGAYVAVCEAAGVPVIVRARSQDWRLRLGMERDATKAEAQKHVRRILGLPSIVTPQHANDAIAVALEAAHDARPRKVRPEPTRVMRVRWSPGLDRSLTTALGLVRAGKARCLSVVLGGVQLDLVDDGTPRAEGG